jgi:hypothetical protein
MRTFEFKLVELEIPVDVLAQASDPKVRTVINPVIENALNEHGKEGWRLHMSGLTSMPTIVLERETEGVSANE